MPLYEYKCSKCGSVFERLFRYILVEPQQCPKCGSRETERLPSSVSTAGKEEDCGQYEGSGARGISFG
ncbi:MAG: zinc ribbon domain-containing protein [Dehalococcoidia bacterium]|nr:zinc ribbon domain-containing protein [Dehalococcoidia bacterium]